MAQSCDRIVRGLRAAGVELDLLHCSERLHRWEERRQAGGRYLACPAGGDPAHALNRLWARLERESAPYTHLVAFGGAVPLLAAPVYAAWMGCPLISLLRGNDLDTALFHPARAQVLARALAASTLVGCVSLGQVRKVQALYPGIQARWIPNGIDLDDWTLHPFDRERGRLWRQEIFPAGPAGPWALRPSQVQEGSDLSARCPAREPAAGALPCPAGRGAGARGGGLDRDRVRGPEPDGPALPGPLRPAPALCRLRLRGAALLLRRHAQCDAGVSGSGAAPRRLPGRGHGGPARGRRPWIPVRSGRPSRRPGCLDPGGQCHRLGSSPDGGRLPRPGGRRADRRSGDPRLSGPVGRRCGQVAQVHEPIANERH